VDVGDHGDRRTGAPAQQVTGPGDRRSALGTAVWIAAGAAVLRLVMAALIAPFPDETYYWEWSRRLAGGFFDHPPAIAVAIRGGTAIFGDTAFGIRFIPVMLGLVAMLAVVEVARRLAGDGAALRAAIVLACLPLAGAGLVLATPDAPLLCFSALAVLGVERAVSDDRSQRAALGWWAFAGVACGAAMSSKYTAVLLPATIVAAIIVVPPLRRQLATPGPYAAVAMASLVMIPVLWWNAHHDWASFRFQLQHGLGPVRGTGIKREGDLLGGQLGLVTPILFVMLATVAIRALRATEESRRRMFAIVSVLTFLFFVYAAWRRPAEANWPAPAYIPALALLAAAEGSAIWRRWLTAGCALGAVVIVATYVQAVHPVIPFLVARKDPMARNAGFRELAERVSSVRDSLARGGAAVFVAAEKYQDASELAFWLPGHPEVLSVNTGYRPNQYDFWPQLRDVAHAGSSLILVGPADSPDSLIATNPGLTALAPEYHQVTLAGIVALGRGGSVRERKRIWVLDSLNSPSP
jgi:4-amino-4-deoxy-L-arabinose transferase-like glycosyltransferase